MCELDEVHKVSVINRQSYYLKLGVFVSLETEDELSLAIRIFLLLIIVTRAVDRYSLHIYVETS